MRAKKIISILILILLLTGIGIGYAVLSSSLTISGTTTMNDAKWDVHFENVVVDSGSVNASTPLISSDKLSVTYNVVLSIPGDYYEFTVDAVNGGTIDAMIDSYNLTVNNQPISNLPNYLEYYVTYDDEEEVSRYHKLAINSSETYKVHVGFKKDIDSSQLPTENINLSLVFNLNYIQANDSATTRPVITYSYGIGGVEDINGLEDLVTTGFKVFGRRKRANGEDVEYSIGFVYNNNIYYIIGKAEKYEYNKQLLLSVIGSDYCTVDDEKIVCSDNGLIIRSSVNGIIGANGGHPYAQCGSVCTLYDSGQFKCYAT